MNHRFTFPLALFLVSGFILSGCTTTSVKQLELINYEATNFSIQIPANWTNFTNPDDKEILLSTSDSGNGNFQTMAISVYRYAGIVKDKTEINLGYCEQHFLDLTINLFKSGAYSITRNDVAFDSETRSCFIEYELGNRPESGLVAKQVHQQRLIIKDKDEYLVEVSMLNNQDQALADQILDSFTLK